MLSLADPPALKGSSSLPVSNVSTNKNIFPRTIQMPKLSKIKIVNSEYEPNME